MDSVNPIIPLRLEKTALCQTMIDHTYNSGYNFPPEKCSHRKKLSQLKKAQSILIPVIKQDPKNELQDEQILSSENSLAKHESHQDQHQLSDKISDVSSTGTSSLSSTQSENHASDASTNRLVVYYNRKDASVAKMQREASIKKKKKMKSCDFETGLPASFHTSTNVTQPQVVSETECISNYRYEYNTIMNQDLSVQPSNFKSDNSLDQVPAIDFLVDAEEDVCSFAVSVEVEQKREVEQEFKHENTDHQKIDRHMRRINGRVAYYQQKKNKTDKGVKCPIPECRLLFIRPNALTKHKKCHRKGGPGCPCIGCTPKHRPKYGVKCSSCGFMELAPRHYRYKHYRDMKVGISCAHCSTKCVSEFHKISNVSSQPGKRWDSPMYFCVHEDCKTEKLIRLCELIKHNKQTHLPQLPVINHQCPRCGVVLKGKAEKKAHYVNCSANQKVEICKECGKRFRHKKYLNMHIQNIHGPKNILCELCGMNFSYNERLAIHIRRFHKNLNNKYTCEHCHDGFPTKSDLKKHLCEKHIIKYRNGSGQIPCKKCDFEFSSKNDLDIHIFVDHPRIQRFHVCRICNREFNREYKLVNHARTHQDASTRPTYSCQYCNKIFLIQSSISRHYKICKSKNCD